MAFEQLVSIIFREGVLLVEEGRGPSEDVVDLERLRGGCEQKGCGEMHGVWVAASAGGAALQERLLVNDLALGGPERCLQRVASVRAAFCLSLLSSMARAKTHAKRVQNRGIGESGLVQLRE